jgi:hypothetical protein
MRPTTAWAPLLGALLLLQCSDPPQRAFAMPKNIEDARGRLLVAIPEGCEIEAARIFMHQHGFDCDPPHAWAGPDGKSPEDTAATPGIAHVCHARKSAAPDAGWRAWTVVLIERRGRLADLRAY